MPERKAVTLGAGMSIKDATDLAERLNALADPIRLRIVSVLAADPGTLAVDLRTHIERTQPTLSYHLRQLRAAGFVEAEVLPRDPVMGCAQPAPLRLADGAMERLADAVRGLVR